MKIVFVLLIFSFAFESCSKEKARFKTVNYKKYAEYIHFSTAEKYFINNEKPFFIFKDEEVWHFDGGTLEKPEAKDDVTESRIYLSENKVIGCNEKKYSIRPVSFVVSAFMALNIGLMYLVLMVV